jgi:PrtD family type I secretion system ABC transporter
MDLGKAQLETRSSIQYFMPLIGALVFSGVINLLALSGPLFMLEIYDRVIPSKSVETLVALLILIAGLYGLSGLLELARSRVMSRVAGMMDAAISSRVAAVIAGASLRTRMTGDILKPAQDADQIRSFLSSSGPMALFDLPWMPIYLAICFFLHPLIGWLAAGAMVVLVIITLFADLVTRRQTRQISEAVSVRNRFGEALHRNAEAIAAMGLLSQAEAQWNEAHERSSELQRKTGDIGGLTSGLSRTVRQMVQSGGLALGAWLVIQGDLSGGAIIAGTTVLARALQPIEQVIGNWRTMVAARQSWRRLEEVFKLFPGEAERTALPAPSRSLSIEGLFAAPPGERQRMTVQNVSFRVEAGTVIGVIGPSASGKSSLVRAITGVWPQARGKVCLDGAALDQWPSPLRGRHIGYMPQNSDLFPSTIALNIARLDRDASHDGIIAAAQAAGVHDMIVALPDGYETQVGDNGVNLSAGQRQRVALARALYGDPFLVVLDEPNSNLDMDGDRALAQAIAGVKARGGIAIVVAHRKSVLAQIDMLLVMENGIAKAFGPRDTVLRGLQQSQGRQRTTTAPALTVIEGEGA